MLFVCDPSTSVICSVGSRFYECKFIRHKNCELSARSRYLKMRAAETSQDVRFSEAIAKRIPLLPEAPEETLVKYGPPIVQAVRNPGGRFVSQKPFPKTPISYSASQARLALDSRLCERINFNVDEDSLYNETELRQLIENLYPPIEWVESNCVQARSVSLTRGRTSDILTLADQIKDIIDTPVSKMFNVSELNQKRLLQAFDEIIRQVLVEKPLQGILLRECREYMEKFLEIRRSVFASNTAFAVRKEVQLLKEIEGMRNKLEENKARKIQLRQKIAHITEERESAEAKHRQMLDTDQDEFQNELQPLISEKRRLISKLKHMANLLI